LASLDDIKNSLRADVSRLTARINSLEDERTNLQITLEKIEEREKIVEDTDRERRFEKAQAKKSEKEQALEKAKNDYHFEQQASAMVGETPDPKYKQAIEAIEAQYTDPAVADIAKQIEKHNAKHKGAV
jgi:predicted  nucleic acid-binding Zn-ribbon protein